MLMMHMKPAGPYHAWRVLILILRCPHEAWYGGIVYNPLLPRVAKSESTITWRLWGEFYSQTHMDRHKNRTKQSQTKLDTSHECFQREEMKKTRDKKCWKYFWCYRYQLGWSLYRHFYISTFCNWFSCVTGHWWDACFGHDWERNIVLLLVHCASKCTVLYMVRI